MKNATHSSGSAAGLLVLGNSLAAVMLLRLAYDLGRLGALFGLFLWCFYAAFLAMGFAQLRAAWSGQVGPELARGQRLGLVLAVLVGLLGSVLDCMGISFHGCSPLCAFLTRVVAPTIALLMVLHGLTGGSGWMTSALVLSFVLLVPNCRCRNPANAFWIDFFGLRA